MTPQGDLPLLWQLRFSHFNEKARWALDYKKVPHRRRSLVPGRHSLRSRRLGGKGTTPLLVAPPQFTYRLPDRWPEEWEQFRRSLAGRHGYRWVQEMFSRHRGQSAEVRDE